MDLEFIFIFLGLIHFSLLYFLVEELVVKSLVLGALLLRYIELAVVFALHGTVFQVAFHSVDTINIFEDSVFFHVTHEINAFLF